MAVIPFQLLAVSRPVDISPLLSELSATLTSSSDVKQKELLKQEIVEMGAFALSGEVVERQFYIKIWDRVSDGVERDLLQKLKLLGGYFSDSGIQTEILEQQDIVRLCNPAGFEHHAGLEPRKKNQSYADENHGMVYAVRWAGLYQLFGR